MAIYRASEVHKMSPKEREEKLNELRAELLREQGVKAAGGAPKNPGRIRALRKTIARILTIQAAAAEGPAPAPRPQPRAPAATSAARKEGKTPKRAKSLGMPAKARKAAGAARRKT